MVFRDFDRIVVAQDCFEELSETQFFQHFRFYKDDVRKIVGLLGDHLVIEGQRNQRLSPELQVLTGAFLFEGVAKL